MPFFRGRRFAKRKRFGRLKSRFMRRASRRFSRFKRRFNPNKLKTVRIKDSRNVYGDRLITWLDSEYLGNITITAGVLTTLSFKHNSLVASDGFGGSVVEAPGYTQYSLFYKQYRVKAFKFSMRFFSNVSSTAANNINLICGINAYTDATEAGKDTSLVELIATRWCKYTHLTQGQGSRSMGKLKGMWNVFKVGGGDVGIATDDDYTGTVNTSATYVAPTKTQTSEVYVGSFNNTNVTTQVDVHFRFRYLVEYFGRINTI